MTRMYKRKTHLFVVIMVMSLGAQSQDLPIYNHYFSNPFFYNPSYSSAKKYAELNLLYRQQWTGIEGAPIFSNLTLTAPISTRLGFGLNIYNNRRGVITTNSAQASLSYKVLFNTNTNLSFGFSAGAGRNSLDINQVDPTDPAVARLLSNSFFLEGQAGMNFQYKNLNIGFSLPQFFDRTIVDSNSLQPVNVNPFNVTISSITYKIHLSPSVSFQPMIVYKTHTNINNKNVMEGYGTLYIKDAFWFGISYRQNYGAGAQVGFQISKILQLGYSHEFASSQVSELNFNTHEFRLSIRLSKGSNQIQNVPPKIKPLPKGYRRR